MSQNPKTYFLVSQVNENMSHSNDPTFSTSSRQEPPKTRQDYGFFDPNETGMSLSGVARKNQPSMTQQGQQESHQNSSFLSFSGVSQMKTDEVALNSRQSLSFEYPSYFGTPTMNTGGNSSFDYGWNMGSQRNTGFTMIPTPGKTGTNNNKNNGETCLSIIEASNNTGSYGIDVTDPSGSSNTDPASFQSASASSSSSLCQQQQRFISQAAYAQNHGAYDIFNSFEPSYTQIPQHRYQNNAEYRYHDAGSQIPPVTSLIFLSRQQIQEILDGLDSPNMGLDSTNSLSNIVLLNIERSESGLHSHSQTQSQRHTQMSNKRDILDGTMSETFETQRNTTTSFQPLSTTSSSLAHQQQQIRQHIVLTKPQWTKILKFSDTDNVLYLAATFVQRDILIHLSEQDGLKIRDTEPGVMVTVYDHDTNTIHNLYLGIRQGYILWKGWKREFIKRRGLRIGDRVGFCWDPCDSTLHFTVVSLANPAEKK